MKIEIIKNSMNDILYLASCVLCGKKLKIDIVQKMDLHDIYEVSVYHGICSLIYSALNSVDDDEIKCNVYFKKLADARFSAVRRYYLFETERKAVLNSLEDNKIWYMPLKGIIIKDYYPKHFLREMSDNDILYDVKFGDAVSDFFTKRGYSKVVNPDDKDESYRKEPVYNFEMHRELFEEEYPKFHQYYSEIKNKLIKDSDNKYGYHMSDEDFYIYMIAHMYKHFSIGGTGIRGLFDIFVFLSKTNDMNNKYIDNELAKLGIKSFNDSLKLLCERISTHFSDYDFADLPSAPEHLLQSMFYSGTYGSNNNILRNSVIALDANNNISFASKVKFMFSRLFPSYEFMHNGYPNVVRNKAMLIFGYVYRIFKIGVKNRKAIIRQISNVAKM